MHEIQENSIKIILFEMWKRVQDGHADSRSYIGDMSIRLRDILYAGFDQQNQERKFWKEYKKWEENETR